MNSKKHTNKNEKAIGRRRPPARPRAFRSVDPLLDAALAMLRARQEARDAEPDQADRERAEAWSQYWHASLEASSAHLALCRHVVGLKLSRVEREVVLVLLLEHLGLLDEETRKAQKIFERLCLSPRAVLKALRSLSPEGRLLRLGLVGYSDEDEPLARRELFLDPALPEMALQNTKQAGRGWRVRTEKDLLDRLARLTYALRQQSDKLDDVMRGYGTLSHAYVWYRRAQRLIQELDVTLQTRPAWKLAAARQQIPRDFEWTVLLALLGKEQGHVCTDDDLFNGAGLARALVREPSAVRRALHVLAPTGMLRRGGWIRPCGGAECLLSDSIEELERTEFELGEKALESLGIERHSGPARTGPCRLVEPRIVLENLALPDATLHALRLALAQARNGDKLFREWGLGGRIAYGRGVTLLFSGPPGTGKTACAEALAEALNRPLLVADYGKIQNCLVGQTEKNIVRAFHEAANRDAVLFWDEADAMFFDRDTASRAWEVRDVNVLLQELEQFEGVCVLATNRKVSLDKALDRRVSLKVPFDRPDRTARRRIWEKLLPPELPLARDVDLDRLADVDLSGGQITNAVLNAARAALARDEEGPIAQRDLLAAATQEKHGSWSSNTRGRIGFSPAGGSPRAAAPAAAPRL
jgi:hypothetical protein